MVKAITILYVESNDGKDGYWRPGENRAEAIAANEGIRAISFFPDRILVGGLALRGARRPGPCWFLGFIYEASLVGW